MVNKQAKHALHIVLMVASLPAGETITTQGLSARLGLSVSYLEGLLKQLRTTPVLRAIRGPGGGYQLGGDPQSISVWDVVSAFSEPAEKPATDRLSGRSTDRSTGRSGGRSSGRRKSMPPKPSSWLSNSWPPASGSSDGVGLSTGRVL